MSVCVTYNPTSTTRIAQVTLKTINQTPFMHYTGAYDRNMILFLVGFNEKTNKENLSST